MEPFRLQTLATGVWERSVSVLPDPALWPTWQALREQVLGACTEVRALGDSSPTGLNLC